MFGEIRSRRRVLRDPSAEADVAEYARRKGWRRIGSRDPAPERGVNEREVMWLTDEALTFHYVEDGVAAHSYVFFEGRDKEVVDAYDAQIVGDMDFWTQDEALRAEEAAEDPRERGLALLRVGLVAPREFDEDIYAAVNKELEEEEEDLRNIALWVMSYSPYPQYRPALRRVAERDPSPDIRELARATLRTLDDEEALE
ncbi:hypothetical protein [Streptomyces triticiradicis]|uniref:HEAT repeat domain-containing protein n=1 Tax=Streptomyces triticiradicis TaxID=2651189 RepID=A0A7J5DMW9_9ACTN|nr:hypothetical protein [Streptomyces triticiradicis]KAB1990058.1 hypothetical protein F8144_02995 [Streptomyces triticiradicis]